MMLRGGMGAKTRAAALAPLNVNSDGPPLLLVIATVQYVGEGFNCPPSTRCSSPRHRIQGTTRPTRRPHPATPSRQETAEGHVYHDIITGVLASSLTKRARLRQPRLPRPTPRTPLFRSSPTQHGTQLYGRLVYMAAELQKPASSGIAWQYSIVSHGNF